MMLHTYIDTELIVRLTFKLVTTQQSEVSHYISFTISNNRKWFNGLRVNLYKAHGINVGGGGVELATLTH